jgi:hypothetical protein
VYTGDSRNPDIERGVSGMWTSMPRVRLADPMRRERHAATLQSTKPVSSAAAREPCTSVSPGNHQVARAGARRRHSAARSRCARDGAGPQTWTQ